MSNIMSSIISNTAVITDCVIVIPNDWTEAPYVSASLDYASHEKLFEFHAGEIKFTELELLGLTKEEAHRLKFDKDVAYIRGGAS